MMIWILFAILTVVAALAVLIPLTRSGRAVARDRQQDVAIYKDQLAEVDRDLARGVIEALEAEAARTEIARRLLQASRQDSGEDDVAGPDRGASLRHKVAAAIAVVVVPLTALGFYLSAGSPDLADQPLAQRLAAASETPEIEIMVARVEDHLANNSEDGRGWAVVAPVYMKLGRADDAATAYRNAIRLLGENAELATRLGEALVVANGGVITAQAWDAFKRAVELEPSAVKPRFYLAIALTQEGRRDDAIMAWQQLLSEANGTEAWVQDARHELAKLGVDLPPMASAGAPRAPLANTGRPGASPPDAGQPDTAAPGPTREDVAAAADMSAGDRQAMITGMVARLSDRLDSEGGSLSEWSRLIRANLVLGNKDGAREALGKARTALADDGAALAELDRMAAETGLNS